MSKRMRELRTSLEVGCLTMPPMIAAIASLAWLLEWLLP